MLLTMLVLALEVVNFDHEDILVSFLQCKSTDSDL